MNDVCELSTRRNVRVDICPRKTFSFLQKQWLIKEKSAGLFKWKSGKREGNCELEAVCQWWRGAKRTRGGRLRLLCVLGSHTVPRPAEMWESFTSSSPAFGSDSCFSKAGSSVNGGFTQEARTIVLVITEESTITEL